MKTLIKASIITTVAILLTIQAHGAGVGSVLLLKGQLKIQKADTYEIIEAPNTRVDIAESDQIHTAAATRAKVNMRGQKETVHLYANSFLTLEQVDDETSRVSVLIGKARFVVEPTVSKLSKQRRKFQIRTGNTFIGIRGTDVVVQTNGIATNVLALAGIVGVANLAALDRIVELVKNQATTTVRDAVPTPAVSVPPAAVEKILAADEAQEWEGVDFGEPPAPPAPAVETPTDAVEESLSAVENAQSAAQDARDQVKESVSASSRNTSVEFTVTEQEDAGSND